MNPEMLTAVGRVILGAFFLVAAYRNFRNFPDRAASARTNYGWMLPAPLVAFGFIMQLAGGVSLIANERTVAGALVLIAFLLVATPLFHNPFMFRGKERDPHLYLTLVNAALCGGLLLVMGSAL